MGEKFQISDIVLDIPETMSKGYLRRQMVAADHQIALLEMQEKMAAAQKDYERLKNKEKISPKEESEAYKKLLITMRAYKVTLNSTVDYIMSFVTQPEDKDAARNLIMDELSEDDYRAVLQRIQDGNPTEEGDENPTEE